jgi:hypothetical protein
MINKLTATEELRRIEDAIDDSILAASADEIREEFAALGMDPDAVVGEMDAATERAKKAAAKIGLERAKHAVVAFKARPKQAPSDSGAMMAKLEAMRLGGGAGVSGMMVAARKGKGLSERDEQGMLDDLAQLAALEAEDPEDE